MYPRVAIIVFAGLTTTVAFCQAQPRITAKQPLNAAWLSPIGQDHPLAGKVWSTSDNQFISEADLVARYEKRLTWPVKLTELPETGGKIPAPQTPCKTVLLDERGKAMSSQQLAAILEQWRDTGTREARFVLGAADGHSDAERAGADLLFAFGPATWPHLLARAMLMEQLYRATSILAGHPYHRAG